MRAGRLKADIALMVCDKPQAYAVTRAVKNDIPVCVVSPKLFKDRKEYEKFIIRVLKSQQVDVVVLAGFMRILTSCLINAYKDRILNIHPSYLPAFKGAHAIRDAFEAKVRETGVTVHLVTLKVDSGRVLRQEKVKILPKDTLESLEKKIHAVEHRLYPAAIDSFLGRKIRKQQTSR